MYDKEFRLHMSRFPQRSWAIILQQAWSMRLKDRVVNRLNNSSPGGNGYSGSSRTRVNDPCRRFNRGRCNFGSSCKYEHRCSYCFKFGHSTLNCRKAQADRNDRGKRQSGSRFGSPNKRNNYKEDHREL